MYKFKKLKIIILMLSMSLLMSSCAIKNNFQNEVSGTIISSQYKSIGTEKGFILRKSYNILGSLSGFYLDDETDNFLNIKVGDYVYLNKSENIMRIDRKDDGSSTLYRFDKNKENPPKVVILKKGRNSKNEVNKKIEEKKISIKEDIDNWR